MALQRSKSSPQAWSSPVVKKGPAYNLRQFSLGKKLLFMENTKSEPAFPLETLKERERRRFLEEQQMAWHQKEEDERGLQEKARRLELKIREQEKATVVEARRKIREERFMASVAAWKQEMAVVAARKFEEEERLRIETETRLRTRREKAEADRRRRMPWWCEECDGSGVCAACGGTGFWDGVFLAKEVGPKAPLVNCGAKFGRQPQGCPHCDGFGAGIRGECQQGTGICSTCNGHKMIWPDFAYHKLNKSLSRGALELDGASPHPSLPCTPAHQG